MDENIAAWLALYERPVVVDFDERTIGDIFSNAQRGILLFNAAGSDSLLAAFSDAATQWKITRGKTALFSHIPVHPIPY